MKDIFAKRARAEYFTVLTDFIESLQQQFPECRETKDWCLWFRNVVQGDDVLMDDGLVKWIEAMQTPLVKGCAKYSKAVESITNAPTLVYHAIAYQDADAADASSEWFRDLHLPTKLTCMGADECDLFWEYIRELNRLAYTAQRKKVPTVPTSEAIAADIAARKRTRDAATTGPAASPRGRAGRGPTATPCARRRSPSTSSSRRWPCLSTAAWALPSR